MDLDYIKELIDDFCYAEYNSGADFTNLKKVAIAYTEITEEEIPLQVYVNVEDREILKYLDNEIISVYRYTDDDFIIELENLDFDELCRV